MDEDLAARIRRIEDLEAIRDIKHRYFIALDKADWPGVVKCFTADAEIDVGLGVQRGHDEIANIFHEVYVKAFDWWSHQASNPVIDITSPTTATGTWELEGFVVTQSPATGLWTAVFYEDEYRRDDGKWLISKSTVVPIFRCNVEVGFTRQRMVGLPDE